MLGDRVVVDGLWRCLCPSFDLVFLSKTPNDLRFLRSQTRPTVTVRRQLAKPLLRPCQRQYSHETTPRAPQGQPPTIARIKYLQRLAKRNPWVAGAISEGADPFVKNEELQHIPTRDIYEALKDLKEADGSYFPVIRLVEYLVKERGEKPNAALYEALITANVCKQYGSARAVGQLFKEMRSLNIPTTPDTYLAILKVTAVHPDYSLVSLALHEMRNRWYNLTPACDISIILSLLRDCQYELAFAKLEQLHKNPILVPAWLLDIFLFVFGELGFHEETLALLRYRQRVVDNLRRAPVSLNTWHFLLEVFSRDAFQPGIKYVWNHAVSTDSIHPPDGVLLAVVNAASMHGDIELAMSAIQILSSRGVRLGLHHYEPLISIYVQQGNLHRAFYCLCIMAKAGLSPDLGSTRPIFTLLRDQPSMMNHALRLLHELKLQNTVPPAAFNVLLEATMFHEGYGVALDLYRTVRQICRDGPDLDTYEIMFRQCNTPRQMSFLAAEMESLSLKPTKAIYDHLVRICTIQDDYEPAFRYLGLMEANTSPGAPATWWISRDTALSLLQRCLRAQDPRFDSLFAECRRRGVVGEDDIRSMVPARAKPRRTPKKKSRLRDIAGPKSLVPVLPDMLALVVREDDARPMVPVLAEPATAPEENSRLPDTTPGYSVEELMESARLP